VSGHRHADPAENALAGHRGGKAGKSWRGRRRRGRSESLLILWWKIYHRKPTKPETPSPPRSAPSPAWIDGTSWCSWPAAAVLVLVVIGLVDLVVLVVTDLVLDLMLVLVLVTVAVAGCRWRAELFVSAYTHCLRCLFDPTEKPRKSLTCRALKEVAGVGFEPTTFRL
jgi:hypothetical protein